MVKRILAAVAAITVLFTMMPQEGVVAEAAKKKPVSTSKAASGSAIATSGSAIASSGSSINVKPGKKKHKKKKKKAARKQPKKTVYLTFDDGPGSKVTPKLLKVLKKNNVKATFFIVGSQAKGQKKLLKQIAKDGHTLAIHTYTHDYKKIYSSKKAYLADFHKTEKLIKDYTGVQPKYFRFPGGGNNHYMSTRLRNSILKELHKEGYKEMDWNCGTSDAAAKYYSTSQLIKYGETSHWGSDPIVLLQHDANSKYHTPDVTAALIRYYKKKGYKFSGLNNYTGPEMCFKRK